MLENNSKTYLFIDESGDHGLTKVDSDFPVFILSGILMNENSCQKITRSLDELKNQFGHIMKLFCIQEILENVKKSLNYY